MGLWDVGNNDEKGERRVVFASGRATAVQTSTHAAGVVVREALTNLKERVRIEGLQRQLDKLKRVAAQSCVVMAPLVSSPRVHRTNKSMLSVGDTIGIMALAPRPAACVGAHRWIGLIVIACGFGGHDGRNERHDIGCASSSGSRKPAFYRHAALNELLVAIAYWARANALFMIDLQVTAAGASAVSNLILGLDVAGLKVWQWLFLLEGLPSSILGLIVFVYLHDKPSQASRLTAEEEVTLDCFLKAEHKNDPTGCPSRVGIENKAIEGDGALFSLAKSAALFARMVGEQLADRAEYLTTGHPEQERVTNLTSRRL